MRISINLATRPFVELRPLFARLRAAMAGLVLLAVGLGFGLHVMNARAASASAQMKALKNHTQQLQQELMASEAKMRQPQNAAVLDRAKFLNDLFAKKSFSWTAVMMDLEDVLPGGVQVTSIEPQINAAGDVNIRLRVSGDRARAVQLVRNLEISKRFLDPRLTGESMQQQQEQAAARMATAPGAVEFEILAGYNPLPAKPKSEASAAAGKSAGKTPARSAAPVKHAASVKPANSAKPVVLPKGGTR